MSALEPPTPSPRGKLSNKLRRPRKGKDADASSLSVAGSSTDGDTSRRGSVDGFLDKMMERRRKSSDDRASGIDSDNRFSKLLSSTMKRGKGKDNANFHNERTGSMASDDADFTGNGTSGNPSEVSLGQGGSGRSSLLTEDSDSESRSKRPSLSPHNSHAGYLTLSSPLIKAQTSSSVDTAITDSTADGGEPAPPPSAQSHVELNDPDVPTQQVSSPRQQDPVIKDTETSNLQSSKPIRKAESVSCPSEGGRVSEEPKSGARRFSFGPSEDNVNINQPDQRERERKTRDDRPRTPSVAGKLPSIDTTNRPETPTSATTTPSTLVTPPTPTLAQSGSPPKFNKPFVTPSAPQLAVSPAGASGSPRNSVRSRSKNANLGASKLSNSTSSGPLTPPIEESKTPGGSLITPSTSSGFFSSVFSAAQNAANQFSNTINTSIAANQKTKPRGDQPALSGGEEVIPGPEAQSVFDSQVTDKVRQPAIDTLGHGELNLAHLGITDSSDISPMTSTNDVSERMLQPSASIQAEDMAQKAEESAAARAVSAAYDKPIVSAISQAMGGRPLSIASASSLGVDQSPSRSATTAPDATDIKRSGSVRSRLSGRTKRRHRASSATTGGTIAAAITSSTTTLTHPGSAASGTGHRQTGFAVASSKRNKDFHQFFRSVPEDDYLIEDYSAALQRDILLHGRLYVSEGHICFSSNILGWVTNLVISFDEIVSIEKKNTAIVFPNAIVIATLQARNVFASLVARDSTYELLIGIWKISHPNLKSSVNGVTLDDAGTGDKTEKAESTGSDDASEDGSDDIYDEDADGDEDPGSFAEAGANGSVAGSDVGEVQAVIRKSSNNPVAAAAPQVNGAPKGLENADAVVTGAAVSADFPGVATHAPTECGEAESHYDKALTDTTIPAPLGKVYSIMFGPASGAFMRKWLVDEQKSRELSYEDDKTGLDAAHKTFVYSYIKPLNAPVGPRQTKCIVTSTLEHFDLEKSVTVRQSTQTPDVPSGNIFTTKTNYCLMWGPGNSTRLIANCTIEWTGKSWLRGPIEKGANDGQTQYVKDIIVAMKTAVTTKPPVKGAARGKGKGRRRQETFDTAGTEAERAAGAAKVEKEANWGLLEPLRGLLGPVVGMVSPIFTPQVIIALLLLLLARSWFFGPKAGAGAGFPITGPERLAAYEEMWRREESELWDWLEDRVGLEQEGKSPLRLRLQKEDAKKRQKVLKAAQAGKRIKDEKLDGRLMDNAIRVTEEKLEAVKEAAQRKRGNKGDL